MVGIVVGNVNHKKISHISIKRRKVTWEDKKPHLNVKEKSLWEGKIQHGIFQY